MQAIFGFLGSLVHLVALAIAAAVTLTLIIVLWRAGALDEAAAWITTLIGGVFAVVGDFFGFLRELVGFARES